MGQYIYFTDEQKLRAGEVDLEHFLLSQGEELIRSGPEKRLNRDHSVTIRGNGWYDHAIKEGGGPVSFVQRFYNLSYPEAMSMLLNGEQGQPYQRAEEMSKALGTRTVMSGSVNMGKDKSQTLQMTERPLMSADELKSMPKGQFIVMKTGMHPMQVTLRLFLDWGITFGKPYEVPEQAQRPVAYASRKELEKAMEITFKLTKIPLAVCLLCTFIIFPTKKHTEESFMSNFTLALLRVFCQGI